MRFQSLFYSIFIKCKVMIPKEKVFNKGYLLRTVLQKPLLVAYNKNIILNKPSINWSNNWSMALQARALREIREPRALNL